MYEITTEPIPILVWGTETDSGTLEQARHLANLPFAFRHVALMPDAHVGYGMPIGGVLAALGQVIPHAVGLDIGCGVRSWRTNVPVADFLEARDLVLSDIQRSVPVGFEWHGASQEDRTELFRDVPDIGALHAEIEKAKRQVGSLGGGNHFLEVQRDGDGIVWAMVHSGSRNLGKQMGEHYDRVAREYDRAHGNDVPPEWGLAHVPVDSEEGEEYLAVMDFCLRFAKDGRRLMQSAMQGAISRRFPGVEPDPHVDVHHNYAAAETHFGRDVTVHRKGAVRAVGTVVVPGSMGSRSYIGRGLASAEAFESCAHGAGRAMGRKQAVRELAAEAVLRDMHEKDIRLFKAKKRDVAEEAAAAYKDIDDVMRQQADLVEPTVSLTPLGVVKG